MVRPRQVELVVDNPNLSAWPNLLVFCWASIIWAFVCCCVVSYAVRHLIDAFRYPRVMTPTPRLEVLHGNPHTPSSLDTDRYKALEPTFYIFFIAMALLLQLLRRR